MGTNDSSDDDEDGSGSGDIIDLDRETVSKEMSDYFGQMKNELRGTNVSEDRRVGSGRVPGFGPVPGSGPDDDEDDEDWDRPLDVDAQLLKNLLESYQSQDGSAGPTSTLLEPLGIKMKKKNP
jgi:hypothetical protein